MQKEEKTYKQADKKIFKPSFGYTQHQKAGQNTQ